MKHKNVLQLDTLVKETTLHSLYEEAVNNTQKTYLSNIYDLLVRNISQDVTNHTTIKRRCNKYG